MSNDEVAGANIFKFEFETPIKRKAADVWRLMTDEIDKWWMPDFRALGEDSVVSLSANCGGNLVEETPDGATLEWYRVQMCLPGKSLYLVGNLAPEWGGPTISMLKLEIAENGENCVLKVSDALLGNVTKSKAAQTKEGWQALFGEGLKGYAEQNS